MLYYVACHHVKAMLRHRSRGGRERQRNLARGHVKATLRRCSRGTKKRQLSLSFFRGGDGENRTRVW